MFTQSFALIVIVSLIIAAKSKSIEESFTSFFIFALIIECNFVTSTAMTIGVYDINMIEPVLLILFFHVLALMVKGHRFNRRMLGMTFLLVAIGVVSLLINYVMPYEKPIIVVGQSWDDYYYGIVDKTQASIGPRNWLVLIRLTIFWFIGCAVAALINREKLIQIAKTVLITMKIHIIFVAFELVTKSFFSSGISFLIRDIVFPSASSALSEIKYRQGIVLLHGFTREPSHLAIALFVFLLITLLLRRLGRPIKHDWAWALACVALMLLSASFSSMGFLLSYLVLLSIVVVQGSFVSSRIDADKSNIDERAVATGVIIAILIAIPLVIIASYALDPSGLYWSKFTNILDKFDLLVAQDYSHLTGDDSGIPRMISMVDSFYVFLDRPLFGIGLGSIGPHSAFFALLAGMGLIGAFIWFSLSVFFSELVSGKRATGWIIAIVLSIGLFTESYGLLYSTILLLLFGILGDRVKDEG